MQLELSVEDRTGIAVNLFNFDKTIKADLKDLAHEFGEFCKELTMFFCPVDEGWMQEHVRTEYPGEGYIFETGWSFDDFVGHGNGRFYPVDQEEGNSKTPPQPSLGPAYKIVQPQYKAAVSHRLEQAVREFNKVL